MHASSAPHQPQRRLARQVRERLVEGLCRGQVDIDKVLLEFFSNLMAQTGTQREMQQRRDAWQSFQQHSGDWMRNVAEAWRSALTETPSSQRGSGFNASELSFELVDDDVVENKIVASRIALTVMEAVSAGFESLRLRVQSVEGRELPKDDILRPETVALHLVEQWVKSGMARDDLQTVLDPLQRELAAVLLKVYQACNDLLQSQGVVAQQDLRVRVNRSPAGSGAAPLQNSPASQALAQTQQAMASAREMAAQASRFGASRMAPTSMHPMQQAMPSMYAGASPLARARQRAQGVMVQLKRLLTQPATGFDMVNAPPASAALAHALAAHRVQAESYYGTVGAPIEDYSPAAVVQVTNVVRNRSAEFKKKADSEGEKAIIEVVALMFQSILTEDRIPPAVRIWFARLQVPVLRVALAEPEFFSNMEHPARKLIDRMAPEDNRKIILVMNKIDLSTHARLLPLTAEMGALHPWDAVFMISATKNNGVADIKKWILGHLPAGPFHYDPESKSDQPDALLAAEITREKLFLRLHEELPYGLHVETTDFESENDSSVTIHQTIIVSEARHKGMVIGKSGSMLKLVGTMAREELEQMFGCHVRLYLEVIVREAWDEKSEVISGMGLDPSA